ncbi:MAG: DNA-binding protein, partial [Alphaproteobacteria bacterium]
MSDTDTRQREVAAFLADPATWEGAPVERVETHGAFVFLAGDRACKMKRAVRYPFLDYSTLALREAACRRELDLNRRTAPQIYLRVEPVVRRAGGGFAIGGEGEPLEWVLLMHRFPQDALLDAMARRGALTAAHAVRLGAVVSRFHAAAERAAADASWGGAAGIGAAVAGNRAALADAPDGFDPAVVADR